MVGYNIIISENEAGEPVRLLNEHVLNGSILLILVSCTLSSFVSTANAKKIAEGELEDTVTDNSTEEENMLLAVNYPETVERMVNLATMIKAKANTNGMFALNIINEEKKESSIKNAEKILNEAVHTAAAADVTLTPLTRYDNDVINGINNVVKEKKVTDLLIALEEDKGFSASFAYNLYNGYLQNETINVLIYHAAQPISTIKKYIVFIPPEFDSEPGFFYALLRVWNVARNSGSLMEFYSSANIISILKNIITKANIEAEFNAIDNWSAVEKISGDIDDDEGLIVLMPKRGKPSYLPQMRKFPEMLNTYFVDKNYLLIYPYSAADEDDIEIRSVSSHGDFTAIGNIISKIFK